MFSNKKPKNNFQNKKKESGFSCQRANVGANSARFIALIIININKLKEIILNEVKEKMHFILLCVICGVHKQTFYLKKNPHVTDNSKNKLNCSDNSPLWTNTFRF